jgi:hypothetical protein
VIGERGRAGEEEESRSRRLWSTLTIGTTLVGTIGLVGRLMFEVLANKLSNRINLGVLRTVPGTVFWAALAILVLVLLAALVVRHRSPLPLSAGRSALPLPPHTDLVGCDDLVPWVVAEARRAGVVLVRGPAGSGASAIAINAARELAAAEPRQRYVDLRGPDPERAESTRRVAIRVLSALGIRPGSFQNPERAAGKVAETLKDTDQVLLLDNVSDYDQVEWAIQQVPGAHVVIAGDFQLPSTPRPSASVHIGPLAVDDALELLQRQGGPQRQGGQLWPGGPPWPGGHQRRPGLLGFLLGHLTRPRQDGGSVAARVAAEPEQARELAERHLQLPRVAILMGQWLADNPAITIGRLLADLEGDDIGAGNSELLLILRRRLDGASAGACRLLSLLALAPTAEFTEDTAAALAGGSKVRTVGHLKELADRSLVEWIQPSRCRVAPEAQQLTGEQRSAAADKSLVRLTKHYAEETDTWTEVLTSGSRPEERAAAEEWFRREDVTLLELLRRMTEPPRKAGPHLWRIADGLETWFRREGRLRDRRAAAAAMVVAAEALGADGAEIVARLRLASAEQVAGDFAAVGEHLDRVGTLLSKPRGSRAERPQYHTGQAVRALVVTADLKSAEGHLDEARRARPRRDTTGQITDLINLAVLQEDPDKAAEYLDQVLSVAEDAHGRELMGVVAWRRGHQEQAKREWSEAYTRYGQLGDDTGRARCLQHHGAALLTGSGTEADRARGRDMLEDSLGLRVIGRGIGVALAHLYLGEDALRMWRLDEVDPHRAAGLAALSPWGDQPTEPALVTEVRARLEALRR